MTKEIEYICKIKLTYWISLTILGIVSFMFGYYLIALHFPYCVIKVNQPIKVINENKTVERDDNLQLLISYKKYYQKEGFVIYQLYNIDNGSAYTILSEYSNLEKGERVIVKSIKIHDYIAVGRYYCVITAKYDFRFQTVLAYFKSEQFKIVEKCK